MTEHQFPPITSVNDRAVNHDQGKLITVDQVELSWQAWTPPAAQGVIVVAHGLAEHSGRYRETAEYLASRIKDEITPKVLLFTGNSDDTIRKEVTALGEPVKA